MLDANQVGISGPPLPRAGRVTSRQLCKGPDAQVLICTTSRMEETQGATLVPQTHLCTSVTLSKTSCLSESRFPRVRDSQAALACHREGT